MNVNYGIVANMVLFVVILIFAIMMCLYCHHSDKYYKLKIPAFTGAIIISITSLGYILGMNIPILAINSLINVGKKVYEKGKEKND